MFPQPSQRCKQGQDIFQEWKNELKAASERDWQVVMFKDRPYDVHVESCEQCRAYQLEQQEKYHERPLERETEKHTEEDGVRRRTHLKPSLVGKQRTPRRTKRNKVRSYAHPA